MGKNLGDRWILVGPSSGSLHEFRQVLRFIRKSGAGGTDRWVAIDGGLDWCIQAKIKPDLAIGDWDSVGRTGKRAMTALDSITLPKNKDRSDFFHAMEAVQFLGARKIIAIGVTGGRADHHLASLLDFLEQCRRWPQVEIELLDPQARYRSLVASSGWQDVGAKNGETFSALSIRGLPLVSIQGARYLITQKALRPGSHGLSNVAVGKICRIRVFRGQVLVVIPGRLR